MHLMSLKYSGNNGARPKATRRDQGKEAGLKKLKTRERFDEIFRIAVMGETVRLV